jgi:hypothetical protein
MWVAPSWIKLRFDVWHALILVLTAFVGGFVTYLQQQTPGDLVTALTHWQTARPIVWGAVAGGLAGIIALLKQSPIQKNQPYPPNGDLTRNGAEPPTPVPPAPEEPRVPSSPRISTRLVSASALAIVFIATPVLGLVSTAAYFLSGCTPAQQAETQDIVSIVLSGLASGENLGQITAQVAAVLCGTPDAGATCTVGEVLVDVEVVVQDVLSYLIDSGQIPVGQRTTATTMRDTLKARIAARGH